MGTLIKAYSGKYVDVFNPTPDMFTVEDIAHALGMRVRFGGHVPYFYSVAQHSTEVARLVSLYHSEYALEALFHDAGEAYLPDIATPHKEEFWRVKEVEHEVTRVIFQSLGLNTNYFNKDSDVYRIIKMADNQAYQDEERLVRNSQVVRGLAPDDAKRKFLAAYDYYKTLLKNDVQETPGFATC
jgi:5'-deoxynucleotidase YfbR-like HD superfamily hydrolase